MTSDPKEEAPIERPVLTFPPAVSEWVLQHYKKVNVILEYGSGGSTVAAAEMDNKTIFSVESDSQWIKKMQDYFEIANPPSKPLMHYANIGKTGKWGKPIDSSAFRRYHLYPISIWDREEFVHPDLVLVDGRFRVACALTCMLKAKKEIPLLFDDYTDRKSYHIIEDFIDLVEVKERMAKFIVKPQNLDADHLSAVIGQFARVF